jgi:hypothetical protein
VADAGGRRSRAPAVLIAVWALFGAPTAIHPPHGAARVVLDIRWYGGGATALIVSLRGKRTRRDKPTAFAHQGPSGYGSSG